MKMPEGYRLEVRPHKAFLDCVVCNLTHERTGITITGMNKVGVGYDIPEDLDALEFELSDMAKGLVEPFFFNGKLIGWDAHFNPSIKAIVADFDCGDMGIQALGVMFHEFWDTFRIKVTESAADKSKDLCICDIRELMTTGCSCGGFQKEQEAGRART